MSGARVLPRLVLAVGLLASVAVCQSAPTDVDPSAGVDHDGGVVTPLEPDALSDPANWWELTAPDPAALRSDPAAHAEALEQQGLWLDLEGGRVSMRGATLHDRGSLGYPIEYLVVNEHGKTHEALFLVKAIPSFLYACLQALELQPGEPTLVELADPLPSEEDIASGAASPWDVRPGYGPLVSITVSWTDNAGAHHESDLEQLLVDVRSELPLPVAGWVFVGSRMGPLRQGREIVDVFMANIEGNIAAIYLDGRGTSLFERNSIEGLDDSLYTFDDANMPERGTRVTLTFEATGGHVAPQPKALEIATPQIEGESKGAESGDSGSTPDSQDIEDSRSPEDSAEPADTPDGAPGGTSGDTENG